MSSIYGIRSSGRNVIVKDDAILQEKVFPAFCLFTSCTCSMAAQNKIAISATRGICCGNDFAIELTEQTVPLAESGTVQGRIVVVMDLSETEPFSLRTETTTGTFPALIRDSTPNLTNGIYEAVLCTYEANETTISNIKMAAEVYKRNVADEFEALKSIHNLKTYTSLSQLGKTIDSVTSLKGLLPNDSQLTLTVNNAEKEALYNKGIIPVSAAGVLIVTNYNMRGEARFIQDMVRSIYVGQTSNAWSTDYDWKRLNAYIELTGTLTAGETTITLTDDSITTGRKFDFLTSIYGVSPVTAPIVTDGSITLEFDAQETDMNVEVRVM